MDPKRKSWNDRQKKLRQALDKASDSQLVSKLFLMQHAAVHSKRLSKSSEHSFENEILGNLSRKGWRFIPRGGNHSIAWIIWHLARVEDVTMNLLVAGKSQILHRGGWPDRLQISAIHTGNGMTDQNVVRLSDAINIKALVEYRIAVGRETRKIIRKLTISDYRQEVDPERIQRIWEEGTILSHAKGIVDYWAKRTIAGLLLMPPTRHCFLHLNEARRIKSQSMTKL